MAKVAERKYGFFIFLNHVELNYFKLRNLIKLINCYFIEKD